jgi:hypothetical protein
VAVFKSPRLPCGSAKVVVGVEHLSNGRPGRAGAGLPAEQHRSDVPRVVPDVKVGVDERLDRRRSAAGKAALHLLQLILSIPHGDRVAAGGRHAQQQARLRPGRKIGERLNGSVRGGNRQDAVADGHGLQDAELPDVAAVPLVGEPERHIPGMDHVNRGAALEQVGPLVNEPVIAIAVVVVVRHLVAERAGMSPRLCKAVDDQVVHR